VQPDVVINLAGEPIAHRWTRARRRHIHDSRVHGTEILAGTLASLRTKPKVLLSGSAIGYYGAHRGDEVLDEDSAAGADFLADTARDWERATMAATHAGIRVVLGRTGIVLGRHGGALPPMLWPFRLGLGGRLGSGRHWMSWILLDDVVRAMRFLIDSTLGGPVNLVSPEPVQNADFARTLAQVLGRPAALPVPAFALHLIFGTMADDTILASQRVRPARLTTAGFQFQHPRLEEALRSELRRSDSKAAR
jgi:uncharacterized protein (TIGR01777 family)